MTRFTCATCGRGFTVRRDILDRYPGWTPSVCLDCRDGASGGGKAPSRARSGGGGGRKAAGRRSATATTTLSPDEVLERYTTGPRNGVFTDGGSAPNPGPGGWAAVYVVSDEIEAEASGAEPDTTNNRMELAAVEAGIDLVPEGTAATIYTDSNLLVRTMNEWAAGWEKRGWKRKSGPVENVDLVKRVYYKLRKRRELEVAWIKAHAGHRWNEYADAVATRAREDLLRGG